MEVTNNWGYGRSPDRSSQTKNLVGKKMENKTNLSDSLFIQLGYEESMPQGDTLCTVCAREGIATEANCGGQAWGFNEDLCIDCFHDMGF